VTEAVDLVRSVVDERQSYDFVVGVAGPGDALASEQTLPTLSLIHKRYPQIVKCLCTNGLLLEEKLGELDEVGVKALTVTINACDSQVGRNICSWVKYRETVYWGEEASALLISKQFDGIRKAIDTGLGLKVNTVLIPGVNDQHLPELASRLREVGVRVMNIIPLVPSGKMRNLLAPTCAELSEIRQKCEAVLPQFHQCQQCRADATFLPKKKGNVSYLSLLPKE